MIGVFVNTAAIIVGSIIGMVFKKAIPHKISKAIMVALGMCVMYVGIDGVLAGDDPIITVISMVIGGTIGTLIDVDKQLTRLGEWIGGRFKSSDGENTVAEGIVSGALVFCIGAMTVVGSINSGLGVPGGLETIYTKSVLDMITAVVLAAGMGIGVMLSAGFVLLFQGGLVLLAKVIAPFLTTPMVNEITCVGSLMIIALGMNVIGVCKIKIANYLPAIVIAPLVVFILSLF